MPAPVAGPRRVQVEMRPEDGFAVGGGGEPGEGEADADGPMVSTESAPCVELLEKRVGWATVVAAARASAELVPTSVGTAKNGAEAMSAVGRARRDSDRRWRRKHKHERRNSPKEQKGRQSLYVARVCENHKNRRR